MRFEWRRYRKKALVIEARRTVEREEIQTLEGTMVANPGDYVIRGVAGEMYPCKPHIFAATYEPFGDQTKEHSEERAKARVAELEAELAKVKGGHDE